ncbi:MAG: hypothetical protein QF898_20260 [SAR202 cluster bacterium]|jgi:hypothetical protein|nr:hypothetical protein [SAR202 cluster bacterium]MDP6514000.1 hypothetical protein [SAR202 cluster bacterium]MDP6714498.1 hypothetical protein [SAR202 cluster bacterium]
MRFRAIPRNRIALWVAILLIAALAACGPCGDDPATSPVASPEITPAAVATVTPTPTQIPLESLSRQHLPGMVLDQTEINTEFTGLQLQERSGYFDPAAAANHTIDPTDTAQDMTSNGYLAGHEQVYSASDPLLRKTVTARVYLWDTTEHARDFIQRHIEASNRYAGGLLENGVTLDSSEQLSPQSIGDQTIATRLAATFEAFDGATFNTTVLMWRRGALVGVVGVLDFDAVDQLPALERLSQRMNDRMDEVLTGSVTAQAPAPNPVIQPTIEAPAQAPTESAVDLTSLTLGIEDLPAGAIIDREGAVEKAGALQAYGRSFKPQSANLVYGSSEFIEVSLVVWEYPNAQSARGPVDFLNNEGVAAARQMAQAQSTSTTALPELDVYDLPTVGDVSIALVLKSSTPSGMVDAIVVHFANGPIRAQLLIVGPSGRVAAEDIASLTQTFNQRIADNLQQ